MNLQGDLVLNGALNAQSVTVGGTITLNGTIQTVTAQIWSAANQVTLTGDSYFIAANDDIYFTSAIVGANYDLTVSTGAGNIRMNTVGTSTGYLGDVTFNSSGVTTLDGPIYAASIQTDSSGLGAGSVVVNAGMLRTSGSQNYREQVTLSVDTSITSSNLYALQNMVALNDLVINGSATLGTMTVGGTYTQTGNVTANSITVADNATINGVASINAFNVAGEYSQTGNLTSQSTAVTGNATIVGDGTLGTMTVGGTYTQTGNVTANSITVGGNITLSGIINTTGSQVWTANNNIIVAGDSSLISGSDIILRGKTYSSGDNHNLTINAANDANVENDIGSAPGVGRRITSDNANDQDLINELRVTAGRDINLLADVTTKNLQDYTANRSINIGSVTGASVLNLDNWVLSGTTGYNAFDPGYVKESNPSLVRTLISVDPKIQFNGAVNDTMAGTHSLVLIAIAREKEQDAEVNFGSTVGATRKLYSMTARTLEYRETAESPSVRGTIRLGGSVSTIANQTFQTDNFEITGGSAISLASDNGKIRVLAKSYRMVVGFSLDYSFANPPEVTEGDGLKRLADVLRNVPSNDISSGVLSSKLMKMARPAEESNESVDAEVSVGDLEESNQNLECKPDDQRAVCSTNSNI